MDARRWLALAIMTLSGGLLVLAYLGMGASVSKGEHLEPWAFLIPGVVFGVPLVWAIGLWFRKGLVTCLSLLGLGLISCLCGAIAFMVLLFRSDVAGVGIGGLQCNMSLGLMFFAGFVALLQGGCIIHLSRNA